MRRRSLPRSTEPGRPSSVSTPAQFATNINVSLSSSEQVSPNFWTDPATGIPYYLAVQTPEPQVASLNRCPIRRFQHRAGAATEIRCPGSSAMWRRSRAAAADQCQPSEHPADLRGLCQCSGPRSRQCRPATSTRSSPSCKGSSSPATSIQVLGQIQSMNDAFRDLGIGLLFAAVFVFLLMVVNYQNFGDPFVVILALPATFCGIVTMLFITGTTLSVPSLMGAIMAVGVASANSILLVTFAREQQLAGRTAFEAAIDAGHTRIRPVLMTAAAMIVGMIPWRSAAPERSRTRPWPAPSSAGSCSQRRRLCSSCPTFSPCCANATTARPSMAYLRRMSHERGREVEVTTQTGHRAASRSARRRGTAPPSGVAAAAGSDLARCWRFSGRSLIGGWRYETQHLETTTTAKQQADFVPSLRVAAVRASDGTMLVTLPATTLAFAQANIFARVSGYIDQA